MHFVVTVFTKSDSREGAIEETTKLLESYNENGEWFADGSRWDWWVVGGRWTGWWDENFNPNLDPKNYTECCFCSGTGTRSDTEQDMKWTLRDGELYKVKEGAKGCNACSGTGYARNWDKHWCEVDSDVMPARSIPRHKSPYAVVTPDGAWHEKGRSGWFGSIEDEMGFSEMSDEDWQQIWERLLDENKECIAVLVDCHV